MVHSLKTKLTVYFSVLLLFSLGSITILFNLTMDSLFAHYANDQRQSQIQQIIQQIEEQYLPESQGYNIDALEVIGNAALQNGLIVHVQARNGEVDWDISVHKAQECQIALQHAEENMHSRYPSFNGGYSEYTYDLSYAGTPTGYLTIGYYSPYALDVDALALLNALNRVTLGLGTAFLIMALVLAFFAAKRIARPISAAVEVAHGIAEGNYGQKIETKTITKELVSLTQSINEMSETLKLREQQKRRLTADVAHELRTPLTNLQSHVEAVIDGVWEPSPELFQGYRDEILRLTRLVEQLQELSNLESGQIELHLEPTPVAALLEDIRLDFLARFQSKGVSLTLGTDPKDISMVCDHDRIKQCLTNLVSNALRATPEGGTVRLEGRQEAGSIQLSVSDTGEGIPAEHLSQLFERFYRVDPSRSQQTGGMGIGLAITKTIVGAHGGTITAESIEGKGSKFTICLPL